MGWRELSDRVLRAATSAGAFGEAVQYVPADGDPFDIRGVFDDAHEPLTTDGEVNVNTTMTVLSIRSGDVPAGVAVEEDRVVVRETTFLIVDVQSDGQGTLDLILNEVTP